MGSITSSGAYTAPASPGTDTVTATSSADPAKSASATVKVTAAPAPVVTAVTVSPAAGSARMSATLQLAATVQGTVADKSVTWKASLGSVTSSGLYTAPAHTGTDTVTANQ